jgi:hypothetical protein
MADDPREFDELPEPLMADLSRLYRADTPPSPAVDQAVLNRARAHLVGRKRLLLLRRVAGAAAAVVLIAAATIPFLLQSQPDVRPRVAHRAEDVNADGVVDIRDALALQQELNRGPIKGWDINGDGVTDRRDVDAIAMLAVRLDREVVR